MAAPRLVPLAALLLLLPACPPADAQATVTARLSGLVAGYGSEAWKDVPPIGQIAGGIGLPLPNPEALGVYANPYLNATRPHQGPEAWLGYGLTATLELEDSAGRPAASAGAFVDAHLRTGAGDIPAKLARVTAARFVAELDLDGERGTEFPVPPPGAAALVVDVYQGAAAPGGVATKLSTAEFPLQVWDAGLDRGAFRFPEASLPGYADVGAGDAALLQTEALRPSGSLNFTADLGRADAGAQALAFIGDAALPVAQGRTDARGRFNFTVDAARLAGDNGSVLAMVEAHLDGDAGSLATAPLAVPVSRRVAQVDGFTFREGGVGAERLPLADVLDVAVSLEGGERPAGGNVTAVTLDGGALAAAPFAPSSGSTFVASIPATLLRREGLAQFRVVAVFLAQDGALFAIAHAARGYMVTGGHAQAAPFERGELALLVRNFNNNFDAVRDDAMRLVVRVHVEGLPGGGTREAQATVEESGEARLAVPFSGDVGDYPVTINATSGELSEGLTGLVVVRPPPSGVLGVPGADAPIVLLAAFALALAAQVRKHRA
jgi:hypothetical protein